MFRATALGHLKNVSIKGISDEELSLEHGNAQLDDRFHETGIDGTGSMFMDSSFEIG